jgi:threo-3-hydroxy-L-aspartate ammonia-lyase
VSTAQTHVIEIDDVRAAAARLHGVAHRTPVFTSHTLNELLDAKVFCKAESFQRTGSFKFRGAYNALAAECSRGEVAGAVAFSSGNHAQAVALAARLLGIPAVIVMPQDAPASKLAATKGYGAEIVSYDRYSQNPAVLAKELAQERGLAFVPPYDHPLIMAGQGTAAAELIAEVGELDALIVPVGGGGLIAGCATAARALLPGIEVRGVEPEVNGDTHSSIAAGRRVRVPIERTIADGQLVETPGELTFAVNHRLLSGVQLVTDHEIIAAMSFLFERMKLVIEPSGATAMAAVLARRWDVAGMRVGLILSGGNVDAARFRELTGSAARSADQ